MTEMTREILNMTKNDETQLPKRSRRRKEAGGNYLYPCFLLMAQIWIVRLRLGNSIQGPRNQDHDQRIFYSGCSFGAIW